MDDPLVLYNQVSAKLKDPQYAEVADKAMTKRRNARRKRALEEEVRDPGRDRGETRSVKPKTKPMLVDESSYISEELMESEKMSQLRRQISELSDRIVENKKQSREAKRIGMPVRARVYEMVCSSCRDQKMVCENEIMRLLAKENRNIK